MGFFFVYIIIVIFCFVLFLKFKKKLIFFIDTYQVTGARFISSSYCVEIIQLLFGFEWISSSFFFLDCKISNILIITNK